MRPIYGLLVCVCGLFAFACQSGPADDPDCTAPGADPALCGGAQFCGGVAGIGCPGIGRCVDTPDTCDPERGGRDCGGTCVCDALAKCKAGDRFDDSPAVCSCVPSAAASCAAVTCVAGSDCTVVNGVATCVPATDPCAVVLCASGQVCRTVDGEARCVSMRDPCAGFPCQPGYRCSAPADAPQCVPVN